jgi:hypothetical protein
MLGFTSKFLCVTALCKFLTQVCAVANGEDTSDPSVSDPNRVVRYFPSALILSSFFEWLLPADVMQEIMTQDSGML